MKAIPIHNFSKLKDDELNTKANHILLCMTGNLHFPDATSKTAKVQTALDDFNEALIAAEDGGRPKTADKIKKRKALEKALKELALYVQLNCNDDVVILLTTGFDVYKDSEPAEEPGAPVNFKVEAGKNSGSVIVSVDANKLARMYVFDYALVTETGEPNWKTAIGKKRMVIKDLIPGKKYMFRAALKGNSADLVFSEIITRFIS
jgi:hypothetical protein